MSLTPSVRITRPQPRSIYARERRTRNGCDGLIPLRERRGGLLCNRGVVAAELAIFDVDDVVVRYDRDVRVDQLARQLGRPADEVTVAVFDSGIEDEADAGRLDAETYLAAISKRIGTTVSRDAWVSSRAAQRGLTQRCPRSWRESPSRSRLRC